MTINTEAFAKALAAGIAAYDDVVRGMVADAAVATNGDGWIEWAGVGKPSIEDHVTIEAKLRDGEILTAYETGHLAWWHDGASDDIIAYRLAK